MRAARQTRGACTHLGNFFISQLRQVCSCTPDRRAPLPRRREHMAMDAQVCAARAA